jgi:hypothetical protein
LVSPANSGVGDKLLNIGIQDQVNKQKQKSLGLKILVKKFTMSYSLSKKIDQGFRPSPTGRQHG